MALRLFGETAALRNFDPAYARLGSNSVIRRCRLNVRFARKRTRLSDFMSTRPSLPPLADLGRSAWQAPLHGLRPAGIGAAGDDAEIGACLPERLLIDVGLGGSILDDARRLGTTCELVPEEMLRALTALGRLRDRRGRGFTLADRKSVV